MHHVEEERPDTAPPADRRVGTEVAHRVLEPLRRTVVEHPECFTVEHEVAAGQRSDRVDDARQPIGDLVEVAGEETHPAAGTMGLHAGAVELPLHRSRAHSRQRRVDVGRRAGQHRQHRSVRLQRERVERLASLGEGDGRRREQVTRHHRRAPHRRDRHVSGARDRRRHHTLERALAQLAPEHADQEPLLAFGGAGEDRPEEIVTLPYRALADERGEPQQARR